MIFITHKKYINIIFNKSSKKYQKKYKNKKSNLYE
jgi:hypothetical protein